MGDLRDCLEELEDHDGKKRIKRIIIEFTEVSSEEDEDEDDDE